MKKISKIKIKENTLKFNQIALNAVEKVILKTIYTAENLQEITSKKIKSSFNFATKQEDIIFNNIEKRKGMVWKNLNKTLDFFTRN